MERQNIASDTLLKILISETARALGRDADFLGSRIVIRRRAGEPNWDANCGIQAPYVLSAFGFAVRRAQEKYNLD